MTRHRPDRVADRIREELARLLHAEARDPGLGFVTLTGVELSPDMRHARVFFSALSSDPELTLDALRRATPFLRRGLARQGGLRYTPQLQFVADPAVAAGIRVEELLKEVRGPGEDDRRDEEERAPSAEQGETD